jgi:hypothetical protein
MINGNLTVVFNNPVLCDYYVSFDAPIYSYEYNIDYDLPYAADQALQKLYEIRLNTSYVSLPMKWLFAYRDAIRFNQTTLGEDASCSLDYEDITGASPMPDCSCKTCEKSMVCDFDFSALTTNEIRTKVYGFSTTFISKYDTYKGAGVIYE